MRCLILLNIPRIHQEAAISEFSHAFFQSVFNPSKKKHAFVNNAGPMTLVAMTCNKMQTNLQRQVET